MEIQSIQRDSKAIEDGDWVDEIPGMGDLRLKVRGYNSVTVIDCRSEKQRAVPLDEREENGMLTIQDSMRITGEVHHEAVLLDWQNMKQGKEEIPYTDSIAKELCTNMDWMSFNDAIVWAASKIDDKKSDNKKLLGKP